MHVKPILVGILAITFFSLATASGQLEEILTKFSTFTNEEYGIQLEYPSEWKIFEDNKVMFIVEGAKLTNKEKDFLRTVDGVNFLIAQYKQGIKSFNSLKNEIKKKLK